MFLFDFKEMMMSGGCRMSKLEVAFFFLSKGDELVGVLVSYVNDVLCGYKKDMKDGTFKNMLETFEFRKWESLKDGVVFRGRELKHLESGGITMEMIAYARSLKTLKVHRERRRVPATALGDNEVHTLHFDTGEAGWLTRKLRYDCVMEVGEL